MNAESAFRRSLPLTLTSFVNRMGTIGLSLIPILLVERNISVADSSFAMTTVKAVSIGGPLIGGWCSDRIGLKKALFLSFACNALGLALIPMADPFWAFILLACIAQLGHAMFPAVARLMVAALLPPRQQQESIGWVRTANNGGQIVSFSLGTLLASFGVAPLLWIDAATSAAAAFIASKLIPARLPSHQSAIGGEKGSAPGASRAQWNLFFLCAFTMAAFNFLVELFMVGTAADCRVTFGADGLRRFSQCMLINTALCTLLAVPATRVLKNPRVALPLGIALTVAGLTLIFGAPLTPPRLYSGAFLYTLGEVVFMSLGSYALIRMTPKHRAQGTVYGFALVIQRVGSILGAGMAFPLLVHGEHPLRFLITTGVLILALSAMVGAGVTNRLAHTEEELP